jgi:peroxiredoxin Q/BCP
MTNNKLKVVMTLSALLLTIWANIPCLSASWSLKDQHMPVLAVGTKAPNFTRFTATGKKITLKDFRGKRPVILYFYPKDETPNCVKEACGFRNFFTGVGNVGAEIIGVSGDSDESHTAFSKHYSLPFELISDADNSLLDLYRVPFFKGSLHTRVTFIIDKRGVIRNVIQYTNDGDEHVREAIKAVKVLNDKSPPEDE